MNKLNVALIGLGVAALAKPQPPNARGWGQSS